MRASFSVVLALCLSGLPVACRDAGDGGLSDTPNPAEPSTVTLLHCCDERVLGPLYQLPARFLVFLPLFTWDPEGEIEGKLVRRWEHSEDYHTWTYHLRTDVRWHDGVPFTARDVKFTHDLLTHPDVLYDTPGAKTVTVLDDSTFQIEYHRRSDPRPTYSVFFPKHLLEDLDPAEFSEWEFWRRPIGNGPYRYVRHVPSTMVELEANPDYCFGKPRIDRVILKFGDRGGVGLVELRSGNVDALPWGSADPSMGPALAGDPDYRVYHSWGLSGNTGIYWNLRHPLLSDARVRRALTLAIDRRELASVRNYPEDVPLYSAVPVDRLHEEGRMPPPLPHDPHEARRLLDEAGWEVRGGADWREKGGQQARFTAVVAEAFGGPEAVFVQDALRRIGVRMEIQRLPGFAAVRDRLEDGDFEAAFHRVNAGTLSQYLGADSPVGYENPEFAGLLSAWDAAWDPVERAGLYLRAADIFQRDVPATLLLPSLQTTVAHRRIRGLSTPYRVFPIWFMDELWIDEQDE